ncbi:MAG: hypothetical protein GY874_23110 [Desulfobacteraceae bacterium]|nr:hypothetical protein [Desulfobacteraceae bacterium]
MLNFNKILFPVSLTCIPTKFAPYILSMASKYASKIHLLHTSRQFDKYMSAYINQAQITEFKKGASSFGKEFTFGANKKLLEFKEKHFKDVSKK